MKSYKSTISSELQSGLDNNVFDASFLEAYTVVDASLSLSANLPPFPKGVPLVSDSRMLLHERIAQLGLISFTFPKHALARNE